MNASSDVLALILGGGAGTRLYPLTKRRAKPAVPIGGKYRLVDIPISNCIHSGIKRIDLLTQFNSVSLHRHIARAYRFDDFSNGWVQILAAERTPRHTDWFQGTADAVRKHMPELRSANTRDILILSGDHLYRMDYRPLIEAHRATNADITLAVTPVARNDAKRFGIVALGPDGCVQEFHEKPSRTAEIDPLAVHADPARPCLASMGVYVFNSQALFRILQTDEGADFGSDILPAALATSSVRTFVFDDYWEDIGTIRSYFEASLALADATPRFSFFDHDWPIFTEPGFFPATVISEGCDLSQVLLSDGCKITTSSVHRAVIGTGSVIGPGARLRNVVMMGADVHKPNHYPANEDESSPEAPALGIGAGCSIENAIIDKGARIGNGVTIRYDPHRPDTETENYVIRDGIVVIPKNGILEPGTII
ncbi:MAG: sugar phosphate nucleotidyltransferase [Polyangiaceae bacterium]